MEDAWSWHDHNRILLKMMKRIGEHYWEELPWNGKLGNDDLFRSRDGFAVRSMAEEVLGEFDDLAIFVMFSVFESIVRREVAANLQPEIKQLQRPILRRSAEQLLKNIEEGSFHTNILELHKLDGKVPANQAINSLVEAISRVRYYRNWVAHGRKIDAKTPHPISPKDAFETLQAFLTHFQAPTGSVSGI